MLNLIQTWNRKFYIKFLMSPFTWKFTGAGINNWHLEAASASSLPHTGQTNTSPTTTDLCCPSGQSLMSFNHSEKLPDLPRNSLCAGQLYRKTFIHPSLIPSWLKTALIQQLKTRHQYHTYSLTPVSVHGFSPKQDYVLWQRFKWPLHPLTQEFSVPELPTSLNRSSFYDLLTDFCNFI